MNIKTKLPALLAASGLLVIAAGVRADIQGYCLRNNPAWTYVRPPACSSNSQCTEERHTTGSSCQYGPGGWCVDGTIFCSFYTRPGTCIIDPGGNYCDFSNSVWTEVTDDPDLAPTCADADGLGGQITN